MMVPGPSTLAKGGLKPATELSCDLSRSSDKEAIVSQDIRDRLARLQAVLEKHRDAFADTPRLSQGWVAFDNDPWNNFGDTPWGNWNDHWSDWANK